MRGMYRQVAELLAQLRRVLHSPAPVTLIITLVVILALISLSIRLERGMANFDSAAWKAAQKVTDAKDNHRYRMTKDLIAQLETRHPTKAEAIEMLGPSQDAEHPYSLQYWVGTATLGRTPCQLRLLFGKDGRFEWARIVDDY